MKKQFTIVLLVLLVFSLMSCAMRRPTGDLTLQVSLDSEDFPSSWPEGSHPGFTYYNVTLTVDGAKYAKSFVQTNSPVWSWNLYDVPVGNCTIDVEAMYSDNNTTKTFASRHKEVLISHRDKAFAEIQCKKLPEQSSCTNNHTEENLILQVSLPSGWPEGSCPDLTCYNVTLTVDGTKYAESRTQTNSTNWKWYLCDVPIGNCTIEVKAMYPDINTGESVSFASGHKEVLISYIDQKTVNIQCRKPEQSENNSF